MSPQEKAQWRHDNIDDMRTRLARMVRQTEQRLRARGFRITRAEIIADLRVALPFTRDKVTTILVRTKQDPELFDVCSELMDHVYAELLRREVS